MLLVYYLCLLILWADSVCVCVCVCVYARMHKRMRACVHACMCVCVLWYEKLLNNDINSHGYLTFCLISTLDGIFWGYYF